MSPDELRSVYDARCRGLGELSEATSWEWHGPLLWAEFDRHGFVTYRDLAGLDGAGLDELVAETVAHYRGRPRVTSLEWKSRGHDRPADLARHLERAGLVPDPEETVMMGECAALAGAAVWTDDVEVRQVGSTGRLHEDVVGMVALQDAVLGSGRGPDVDAVLAAERSDPGHRWVAVAQETVVAAGRLGVVHGSEVAGLWGGVTHPGWRGRGLYRALVAARARAAHAAGVRYLMSDCTPMSRPILQRAGLVAVTTTTPYVWTRP